MDLSTLYKKMKLEKEEEDNMILGRLLLTRRDNLSLLLR